MSAQAFIAFLRCEANQAEERARHLRATAASIEANSSADGAGRKSIGTKRKLNSNKLKRQVTAYTCFVAENYELIRKNHDPSMGMKDAITLIARQWAATSDEEKQLWKERAMSQNAQHGLPGYPAELLVDGAAQYPDADEGDGSQEKSKKKRSPVKKASKSALV